MANHILSWRSALFGMALLVASAAHGGPLAEKLKQRFADRAAEDPAAGATELSYGKHALQALDYWKATSADAPLVVFVHGGGWKRGDKGNATGAAKVTHLLGQGYAVASLNYRLVPDSTVEDQASDVATAIAYLREHAAKLGFDANRIVLMGHSAGAHLSALVGTDPRYLKQAGLSMDMLSGVVLLDGAAYDVPSQMGENARIMGDTYRQAFGTDPERQRALSPTLHASQPDVANFLILHIDRADGKRQSEMLASALKKAGSRVSLQAIDGRGLRGHADINRRLGEPDYPATPVVDGFLKRVFG